MSLPRYTTAIIGRADAIGEVDSLLEHARLVTIVGAGGIGKTRIAAEIAKNIRDKTVAFVDLEPVRDPDLIVATVAAAVAVELRGTTDAEAALVKLLAQRSMLLVLDNCEHVLRRLSGLCQLLLASCPHLRILATSREAFGIDAESIYRLGTLDDEASVRLFIERTGSEGSRFLESPADRAIIGEIGRRLDGMPLAIELAAARMEGRTPKALLARLTERFRLLGQDEKHAARRHHRTLRAAMDWSYDLLSKKERAIFARLGVFNGEFSREAVENVVEENVDLDAFVNKSLVVADVDSPGRFRLLESMREYALLNLEAKDADRVNRAHGVYYGELSARVAADFGPIPEALWLARYAPEIDNFRAALAWMQRHDLTLAAATLGNLRDYWFHINLSSEGLSRSQVMVATLRLDDDRALGPLLTVASLAWRAGENRTSYEAAERALGIAERLKDERSTAQARYSVGWALFKLGEFERAIVELRGAVALFHETNQPLRALLAEIDYAIALKRFDPRTGRALLTKSLPAAKNSGWSRAAMRAETGLAEYAFLDGDVALAIELGNEALATARAGGSVYALTVALVNMTAYLSIAGEDARAIGAEAVSLGRAYGFRIAVEWALQSLAIGVAERGNARNAAAVLGHVDAFVEEVGAEREPTEVTVRQRLFEAVSGALEESVLDAVMRQGWALSLDEACGLVV